MRVVEIPAIVEMAEERDRRECVALDKKIDGANRQLAQWLIDHPTYPNTAVAKWLDCDESRPRFLRKWANGGFVENYRSKIHKRSESVLGPNEGLKTNDNFQDDDLEPSPEMEDPTQILTNVLDSIKHAKSVAEAYRKILKSSPFDREAKTQIYNAINQLIVKWRTVQSTLDKKGQGNGQNQNH
jgi:hypothetical protein